MAKTHLYFLKDEGVISETTLQREQHKELTDEQFAERLINSSHSIYHVHEELETILERKQINNLDKVPRNLVLMLRVALPINHTDYFKNLGL